MEREEFEKIVKSISDDDLRAFLLETTADFFQSERPDWDELLDIAYFGRRGFSEMNSEELQKVASHSSISRGRRSPP